MASRIVRSVALSGPHQLTAQKSRPARRLCARCSAITVGIVGAIQPGQRLLRRIQFLPHEIVPVVRQRAIVDAVPGIVVGADHRPKVVRRPRRRQDSTRRASLLAADPAPRRPGTPATPTNHSTCRTARLRCRMRHHGLLVPTDAAMKRLANYAEALRQSSIRWATPISGGSDSDSRTIVDSRSGKSCWRFYAAGSAIGSAGRGRSRQRESGSNRAEWTVVDNYLNAIDYAIIGLYLAVLGGARACTSSGAPRPGWSSTCSAIARCRGGCWASRA